MFLYHLYQIVDVGPSISKKALLFIQQASIIQQIVMGMLQVAVAQMVKKYDVAVKFFYDDLCTFAHEEGFSKAMADPKGLFW